MKKVLLIDDEPDLLAVFKTRIEANHYECITASFPTDGIKIASSWKPDLILLDLNMPAMSGYGVLWALKGDPTLARIPILILSSFNDDEIVRAALDFGAMGYIHKACGPEKLMTMIQEYVAG